MPRNLDKLTPEKEFLLDPFTYASYNPWFQRNKGLPTPFTGFYSTDVTASKALAFLDDAATGGKPFFLTIAPIGPHVNVNVLACDVFSAPKPALRHKDLFPNEDVPRKSSFSPDMVRPSNPRAVSMF